MTDLAVKLDVTTALDNAFVNIKPKDIPTPNERLAMQAQIIKALYLNFCTMTMEEVKLAIFKGSMGDFKAKPDEVVYITPKNVCDWIRAYVEQVKKDAIAKQLKWESDNEKVKELSPEKQEEIIQKWVQEEIIEKFNESKKQGKLLVEERSNVIYRYLTNRGIWQPTEELRTKTYQEAKARFIAGHDKSSFQRHEWNDWDEFKQPEFDERPRSEKQRNSIFLKVVSIAKDNMVNKLFNDLLEMDADIEEFLKRN